MTRHRSHAPLRLPVLALIGLLSVGLAGCDIFGSAVDQRAPSVAINEPYDGATITGGNARIIVSATPLGEDNFVSFINVNLDGVRIGEAIWDGSQYIFPWDTRTFEDGLHRIEAVAFDANQSRGVSDPVTIRIANVSAGTGPLLAIEQPEWDADVEGNVRVLARTVGAQPPVTRVEYLVNGIPVFAEDSPASPYIFDWDTTGFPPGEHVLQIKAYSGDLVFQLSDPVRISLMAPGNDDDPVDARPGEVIFKGAGFSGAVYGSAAVGFNDDIYIGTTSDTLYAFESDGTLRWTFGTRGPIRSSPVVGNNEDVFVASEDGHLYGLSSEGHQLWTPYPQSVPTAELRTTPALGVDGVLYFGDSAGKVHAVNSFDGLAVPGWPVQVSTGSVAVPPAIARDHTIIVAGMDGYVYALARDGSRLWKSARAFGSIQSGMALVERELSVTLPTGEVRRTSAVVIYIVSNDGNVYAIAGETGDLLWSYTLTGPMRSGPIVAQDGSIYVGTSTGLWALNEEADAFTQRLRWILPEPDVGTPAMDTNGVIYFVSRQKLIAVNPNNTPYWEYELNTFADGPITINRQGQILIAGRNNLLYGIETGSSGLARGKWPMFMRNARHTGRLGIDETDG